MGLARRSRWPAFWLKQAFLMLAGTLLTGFLTLFLAKFLNRYLPGHWARAFAVGLAVAVVFWLTRLANPKSKLFRGIPPWVAGFFAALGTHVAGLWLHG